MSNQVGCASTLVKDGVNGFTFSSDDFDELARTLVMACTMHEGEHLRIGAKSREIISEWGLERFCQGAYDTIQYVSGQEKNTGCFWQILLLIYGKAGTYLHEDELAFMKYLALFLIKLHYFLNRKGIIAHGLGRAQQLLKEKFIFKFMDMKFLYLPFIEGSYDYLLIGKSNEPETQTFLNNILGSEFEVNFIDVGASVGEFVISVCKHTNVKRIYAFEPRPDCAEVIRQNVVLNGLKNVEVVQKAVSDHEGKIRFHQNPGGTSSGIFKVSELRKSDVEVESTKLDSIIPSDLKNPVMLIDVEGAEPLVLNGGKDLINNSLPLIIFEYNDTSKKHYQIGDIRNILGEGYEIFRLRGDGYLDRNFINTWNCVAVNVNSNFNCVIQPLIKVNS